MILHSTAKFTSKHMVPMGSSLSPVNADVVMQDLEIACLNSINCQLTFYYWYVDDIVITAPRNKIDLIFKTFNDYHNRLKFTIEYEENRSLSFLDLRLTISDNLIHIDWFHKKRSRQDSYLFIPAIHCAIRLAWSMI